MRFLDTCGLKTYKLNLAKAKVISRRIARMKETDQVPCLRGAKVAEFRIRKE